MKPRISLRTALWAATLAAVGLGWLTDRSRLAELLRQEREQVKAEQLYTFTAEQRLFQFQNDAESLKKELKLYEEHQAP